MNKFTERIALDQFNFVEVEGNTFEDMVQSAEQVKNAAGYKDRLHKEAKPAGYQSSEPFPKEMGMESSGVTCDKCGAELVERSGQKNGKNWSGLFCPNSPKGDRTHTVKWL